MEIIIRVIHMKDKIEKIKKIEELLKESEKIKENGKNFLLKVPIDYEPSPPNVISGFPDYHWGSLNEKLKIQQSEIITKYKVWYYKALPLVQKYLSDETKEFVQKYKNDPLSD